MSLDESRPSRLPMVSRTKSARDTDNMDVAFGGPEAFKLVFVRAHFRSGSGIADMTIALDSVAGAEWDTQLYVARDRGAGADLHLVIGADERRDPSPWAFQASDQIRFTWTNPGAVPWALEIGYEPM